MHMSEFCLASLELEVLEEEVSTLQSHFHSAFNTLEVEIIRHFKHAIQWH